MYADGTERWFRCSYLETRQLEDFHAELFVIGLMVYVTIEHNEQLQRHGVRMVAVCRDSQSPFRRAAQQEPRPVQGLAPQVNRGAQVLFTHGMATTIHWVTEPSCIPVNNVANCQAILPQDSTADTVIERPYTSVWNKASRISKWRSPGKAHWDAHMWSKHLSYAPNGGTGTARPVPMTIVKSLAPRFYILEFGHERTGV